MSATEKHTVQFKRSNNANHSTALYVPFVHLEGDTMTGPLEIAASATAGAPKVQLSYNATTESLDFTFT
jgi:hypothetical protein